MRKQKRPSLSLIGAASVLAGVSVVAGCGNDEQVDVQRASYRSLADCQADWPRAGDCTYAADGAQGTSGASQTGSSGSAHGSGGGGGWHGPYYTRSGTVYHRDGAESSGSVHPDHAAGFTRTSMSEGALSGHGAGGISRGGFGESGHAGGGEGGHGG